MTDELIGAHHGPAFAGETPMLIVSVLLRSFGDTFGVAKVYGDRIDVWRNGNFIGKAATLDKAHRLANRVYDREINRRA